jgi:hypothetical protein
VLLKTEGVTPVKFLNLRQKWEVRLKPESAGNGHEYSILELKAA